MENVSKADIYNVVTDRRLKSIDVKIYMYILSSSISDFKQEHLADRLDVTRENLNRSIQKLKALGYISVIKSNSLTGSDYYKMECLDYDTSKEMEVRRKLKSNRVKYIVNSEMLTLFTLEQLMELCNIDIKASNKKLKTEDDIKIHDVNVDSEDEDSLPFVTVKNKSDIYDFFILYKLYYKKLYEVDLPSSCIDNPIDIKDALLFISYAHNFRDCLNSDRIVDIIDDFKRKYLEQMITYYYNNDVLDRDFFITYNTINKEEFKCREISFLYLMKVLGFENRETTPVITKFKVLLSLKGLDIKDSYYFIETFEIIRELNPNGFVKDSMFNLDLDTLEHIYKEKLI